MERFCTSVERFFTLSSAAVVTGWVMRERRGGGKPGRNWCMLFISWRVWTWTMVSQVMANYLSFRYNIWKRLLISCPVCKSKKLMLNFLQQKLRSIKTLKETQAVAFILQVPPPPPPSRSVLKHFFDQCEKQILEHSVQYCKKFM